jgi:hypothetical protein
MKGILIFVCISIVSALTAQYDHEAVFPDKIGDELKILVVDNFRPVNVLSYSDARDTMYAIIYNVNDTIAGIYTDHKVYVTPGEDPSVAVFMDGVPNGINAEHSYPQSKGAGDGNPRSDMHHLFPSRVSANSARGSMPFAEINDNITQTWYYKTIESSAGPSLDVRDNYSEKSSTRWEPREEAKGNIARAIFYFYTMYQTQADNADPEFFGLQKDVLCEWHDLDPVDQLEWERSKMIGKWQDDKANPFVLDCTLAGRMYCPAVSAACQLVDVDVEEIVEEFRLIQNPFSSAILLEGASAQNKIHDVKIYSLLGELISVNDFSIEGNSITIPTDNLIAGTYFIRINFENNNKLQSQVIKGIKTN